MAEIIALSALNPGSVYPETTADKLRLYTNRLCPYAQRTRMLLAHKQLPYELVNVNFFDKPDWFVDRFPLGQLPAMEMNEKKVSDSLILNDYLDEVYPQDKLTPVDPYVKATHRIHLEHWNKVIALYYKVALGSDEKDRALTMDAIRDKLAYFENVLTKDFFGGDNFSMLDISIWPHMERLLFVEQALSCELVSGSNFPKLNAWIQTMMETTPVKATYLDMKYHVEFYHSYKTGNVNFDVGL